LSGCARNSSGKEWITPGVAVWKALLVVKNVLAAQNTTASGEFHLSRLKNYPVAHQCVARTAGGF
jgi:hypothetical protein